jgi:hypothetical protein
MAPTFTQIHQEYIEIIRNNYGCRAGTKQGLRKVRLKNTVRTKISSCVLLPWLEQRSAGLSLAR